MKQLLRDDLDLFTMTVHGDGVTLQLYDRSISRPINLWLTHSEAMELAAHCSTQLTWWRSDGYRWNVQESATYTQTVENSYRLSGRKPADLAKQAPERGNSPGQPAPPIKPGC